MYCMTSRSRKKKPDRPDHALLLSQLQQVAAGLGETFAPFCEVVLHDRVRTIPSWPCTTTCPGAKWATPPPNWAWRALPTSASAVLTNYANTLPDGRQAKSIDRYQGRRWQVRGGAVHEHRPDAVRRLQGMLRQFGGIDGAVRVAETLEPAGADALRSRIDDFATRLSTTPRSLKAEDRRQLMRELRQSGCMDVRRAAEIVAAHLGVSRATVYNDEKD
jgi:predicted transcriptional regulator YheO